MTHQISFNPLSPISY